MNVIQYGDTESQRIAAIVEFNRQEIDNLQYDGEYIVNLEVANIWILGSSPDAVMKRWQISGDRFVSLTQDDILNIKNGNTHVTTFETLHNIFKIAIRLSKDRGVPGKKPLDGHQEELVL